MAKKKELPAHIEHALSFRPVRAFVVYKEPGGEWAQSFGIQEYEIDVDLLKKNGVLVSTTQPDLMQICLNNLERKIRGFFEV